MGTLMAQGPMERCPVKEQHEVHPNAREGVLNAWCDGQPVLEPFVELTVRVPLGEFGAEGGTHAEVLRDIRDEGIGTYVVDPIGDPGVAVALRLRTADGVDRVYPVKRGVPEGQGTLW